MTKLTNWEKTLFLAAAFLLAIPCASASLTTARILDGAGSVVTLGYDTSTMSYADSSIKNPNIFVEICASDPANDLQDKYAGIFYKSGNAKVEVDVLPAKITTYSGSCATLDMDLSIFKARYAAIPNICVADNTDMLNPTCIQLASSDGWLSGGFVVSYTDYGATVDAAVTTATTETGAGISLSRPYLALGIKDSGGTVVDSALVSLNEYTALSKPAGDFKFNVNGIEPTSPGAGTAAPSGGGGGGSLPFNCTFVDSFDKIVPENPVRIKIDNYCTYLTQIDITSSVKLGDSKVVTYGNWSFSIKPEWGKVLQYERFITTFEDQNISLVKVTFKVPKEWILNNSINAEGGVKLNRFTNRWERMPTYRVDEDRYFVYYEAYGRGLSFTAITGEENAVAVPFCGDGVCVPPETFWNCPQDCPPPSITFEKLKYHFNWLLLAVALAMIAIIGYATSRYFKHAVAPAEEIESEEFAAPELPGAEIPEIDIGIPEVRKEFEAAMPEITGEPLPELDEFKGKKKVPEIRMPKFPKIALPKFEMKKRPEIKMPELPEIKLPEFPELPVQPETIVREKPTAIQKMPVVYNPPPRSPRLAPDVISRYRKLPKSMELLERQVKESSRRIDSELSKNSRLKDASERREKSFAVPKPANIELPQLGKMQEEANLANLELKGRKAVKPKKPEITVQAANKAPAAKPRPDTSRKVMRQLQENIMNVGETVEQVKKSVKHEAGKGH